MQNMKEVTQPNGAVISETNNLSITLIKHGEDVTSYHYDEFGRMKQKLCPLGIETNYEFNPMGQLKSLCHVQKGTDMRGRRFEKNLEQLHYLYDDLGKRCEPKVGKWLDALEDTLIDGMPALRVDCTLEG